MAFFRYPGGKSKTKDDIIRRIIDTSDKKTSEYRDPFFGSGTIGIDYLMFNTDIYTVWLNDKDFGISCLWTSVIKEPNQLKNLVMAYKPTVKSFKRFRYDLLHPDEDKPVDKVMTAFQKLVIHQVTQGGYGTKKKVPIGGLLQNRKEKITARWCPSMLCKNIDRLYKRFSKLDVKNRECTNLDFEEVIINYRDRMIIYLDPPDYTRGNKMYQQGFTKEDHVRLANILKGLKSKWVLSYDNCPEIRELYSGCKIETLGDEKTQELLIRP